jgi:hypothetical protein
LIQIAPIAYFTAPRAVCQYIGGVTETICWSDGGIAKARKMPGKAARRRAAKPTIVAPAFTRR